MSNPTTNTPAQTMTTASQGLANAVPLLVAMPRNQASGWQVPALQPLPA